MSTSHETKTDYFLFIMIVFPVLGVNICLQKAAERAKMDMLRLDELLSEESDGSRTPSRPPIGSKT